MCACEIFVSSCKTKFLCFSSPHALVVDKNNRTQVDPNYCDSKFHTMGDHQTDVTKIVSFLVTPVWWSPLAWNFESRKFRSTCVLLFYFSSASWALCWELVISPGFLVVDNTEKWTACSLSLTLLKIPWFSQITSYTTGPIAKEKKKRRPPQCTYCWYIIVGP